MTTLDALPRLLRRRRRVFAGYAIASAAYVAWRATCTLNPDAPIYSGLFFALETYAVVCALVFYAIVLDRRRPTPPPAEPGWTVDVFICTYNESVALLRQTVRRAMAMDYRHHTWLLDDGRRPEVRALAEELGCRYLTRPQNTHYKAGNLNHALSHSFAELVVVLDADHLVRRHFLTRVIGYFTDPHVAIVQTPQVFYNVDSFQHHFDAGRRRMWHEGAIFHHAMQPGANRWGAAFFVGTGAVLRRSALDHIGGFATETVTEDAHTCMRLHAAGFRSVYHDEPLAYLLAPDSLLQYLTQRLRWGQGSMQILRVDNPLVKRGLSWRHRLVYTAALSSFAQAVVHLAYYIAPALFLLGGPAPIAVDRPIEFAPIVAHIVVDLAVFKFFLGRLARPLLAECFKFINVYAFIKSLGGLFGARRLKFAVTPKGRDSGASLRLLLPQIVLLALNVTAFAHGLLALASAPPTPMHTLGLGVATFFAGMFSLVGAMTLLYAHERIASKTEYTFPDHVGAILTTSTGTSAQGAIVRANEEELHVVLPFVDLSLEPGARVELELALEDGASDVHVHARVDSAQTSEERCVLKLALVDLRPATRDRLFDRLAERAIPAMIDPLTLAWRDTDDRGPVAELSPYYLPIETTVL